MSTVVAKNNKIFFLVLEILAIVFSALYTILYIKEFKECFYFAFLGSAIYTYLCYKRHIVAESFLQLFFVLFSIYGWFNWGAEFTEQTYPIWLNITILGGSIIGIFGLGYFLKHKTKSKLPYLDAYTTILCLSGTWLMVNFVHVNWLYWIAADVISIYLYYQRGLKLSVLLYVFYLYLSIVGYFRLPLPF